MSVEPAIKGPNGIIMPFLIRPANTRMIPATIPAKQKSIKERKVSSAPRTRPVRQSNLMSPPPIESPLENVCITKAIM